jgi:hypothetical protein
MRHNAATRKGKKPWRRISVARGDLRTRGFRSKTNRLAHDHRGVDQFDHLILKILQIKRCAFAWRLPAGASPNTRPDILKAAKQIALLDHVPADAIHFVSHFRQNFQRQKISTMNPIVKNLAQQQRVALGISRQFGAKQRQFSNVTHKLSSAVSNERLPSLSNIGSIPKGGGFTSRPLSKQSQ